MMAIGKAINMLDDGQFAAFIGFECRCGCLAEYNSSNNLVYCINPRCIRKGSVYRVQLTVQELHGSAA